MEDAWRPLTTWVWRDLPASSFKVEQRTWREYRKAQLRERSVSESAITVFWVGDEVPAGKRRLENCKLGVENAALATQF